MRAGVTAVAVVTLAAPAPAGGVAVALASSNAAVAGVPAAVVVPRGPVDRAGPRDDARHAARRPVTLTAALGGSVRTAAVTVTVR